MTASSSNYKHTDLFYFFLKFSAPKACITLTSNFSTEVEVTMM